MNTENLNNEPEEVEEEESTVEVDMSSLNIDPMSSSFEDMQKVFDSFWKQASEINESRKEGKPKATDAMSLASEEWKTSIADVNPALLSQMALLPEFHEHIMSTVDLSTASLDLLTEKLSTILADLKAEKEYRLFKMAQRIKLERNITLSVDEEEEYARSVVTEMRNLIKMRVEMEATRAKMTKNYVRQDPREINLPKLPRLPRGEGSKPVGRNASLSYMEYHVLLNDGRHFHFAPGETTLGDIAHTVLAKGTYRPTLKSLEDMLAKQGIKTQTQLGNGKEWSIYTPNGIVVGIYRK